MITAKQAIETMTKEDAETLARCEAQIDIALAKYDGTMIRVDFSTNTRRKVLDKLCAMYRENGWTAVIRSGDQRDPGTWIEFEADHGPRSHP